MAKTGRPTKLTDELIEEICKLVAEGDRPEVAAGVNGIGRATFYEWMDRGLKGDEPFRTFRTSVERARDQFESEARRCILRGDDKGESFGRAKASLEVLSRRMPRQWAQQVKHHVETVEDEFLAALEQVCNDPAVHERVRQEKDCRFVFIAFCEALARGEGEGEAAGDPGERAATVH